MPTYSHTWSGTTLGPFNGTKFGGGAAMTVVGGVASVYSGSAPDADKVTGHTYTTAMAGPKHYAQIAYNERGGAPPTRGAGVLVGGNSATPTTGVFCNVSGWSSSNSAVIYTLDDGTNFTQRVISSATATTGDEIKLETTHNGSHYVYTVYKNDTSILSWEDTGDLITPGNYVGPTFVGSFSFGTWWWPQAATAFEANDEASIAKTSGFTAVSGVTSVTL